MTGETSGSEPTHARTGSGHTDGGLTGGCLCGAVRYRTAGPPLRVGLCHCSTCKRQGGSPLPSFAVFRADAVQVTGETQGFRTSATIDRRFCPACGSPVYGDEGEEYAVPVGTFDEPQRLPPPAYELWAVRRLSWLDDIGALKRYEHDRNDG
ncbi:hypothetical protein ABIE65_004226 [Constrictibacter sp. MBR-5]|jgi:hypothetical protein|uniref:GFA family protein n=1 Tax=Constrictibacter sp. MBR-5 TaxID=3156467 RepID=UPI00339B7212